MKKLVSIIVPVHNSSKYLKNCIDSLLNETYKNIEIIVVENGSTDNSLEILECYKDKIHLTKLNAKGLSKARNKGISLAKGDYIAFVDSDDFIEPNMIDELVNNLEKNNSDLSICNITEIHEYTNKIIKRNEYPCSLIDQKEINKNLIKFNYAVWNKLYKSEIIKENNIKFPDDIKYEDISFSLQYITKCKKISKTNEYLYNYIIHKSSEQTTVDKKVFDIFKIMDICKNFITAENLEDIYIKELTTYALKMRYVKDKHLRKNFINEVYKNLKLNYPYWKKCNYIKNLNIIKRIIIKNKPLLKVYTFIYSVL